MPPEPDEGVVEHPPTSRMGELQTEGAVGRVIAADGVEACRAPFEDGQIDAVTAPDLLLLSLLGAIEGTALVGEQQRPPGTGQWCVAMPRAWTMVDSAFIDSDAEGRWDRYYERFVSPITGLESPGAPAMTVEEAAALRPAT